MTEKKIAILGDGKMAGDCIAAVAAREKLRLAACVHHRSSSWSIGPEKVPRQTPVVACDNMNDEEVVAMLSEIRPDLVVNANSFDILQQPILQTAKDGVINFHNGPLPDYRGMNIPTWAIYNGEKTHGVTWHRVVPAVDAGPILKQTYFDIVPAETAITLVFKCLSAGKRLFEELMDEYSERLLPKGKPQDGNGRLYLGREIPNDGYVDFGQSREALSRFARAVTFRPFSEPSLRPRFRVDDRLLYAETIEIVDPPSGAREPGTILEVSAGAMTIATRDAAVQIFDLFDDRGEPVNPGSIVCGPTRATGSS